MLSHPRRRNKVGRRNQKRRWPKHLQKKSHLRIRKITMESRGNQDSNARLCVRIDFRARLCNSISVLPAGMGTVLQSCVQCLYLVTFEIKILSKMICGMTSWVQKLVVSMFCTGHCCRIMVSVYFSWLFREKKGSQSWLFCAWRPEYVTKKSQCHVLSHATVRVTKKNVMYSWLFFLPVTNSWHFVTNRSRSCYQCIFDDHLKLDY